MGTQDRTWLCLALVRLVFFIFNYSLTLTLSNFLIITHYPPMNLNRKTPVFLILGMLVLLGMADDAMARSKALVIGVSDYQDQEIRDLTFPQRDAEVFATYLKNQYHLKVDGEDLSLLTNSYASTSKVLLALDRLFDLPGELDTVFLFYSGYGVVDHRSVSAPEHIFFYDTPGTNSDAGSFDLFGKFMELAQKRKVKYCVVMNVYPVRDDAEAEFEVLGIQPQPTKGIKSKSTLYYNSLNEWEDLFEPETQIKSAFSLNDFLMQGLLGRADANGDHFVNWKELRTYLEKPQNESLYKRGFVTVTFSSPGKFKLRADGLGQQNDAAQETRLLYSLLASREDLLKGAAYLKLNDSLKLMIEEFIVAIKLSKLMPPEDGNASDQCDELLKSPEFQEMHGDIKRRMAFALLDEVQQVLNAYLNVDNQELRDRRERSSKYQIYPSYLLRVEQLLGTRHYYNPQIRAKRLYFEGLVLRHSALEPGDSSLLKMALSKQQEANSLQEGASYILNEIGVNYFLLGDLGSAEQNFVSATWHSPGWSVPYYNLSTLFRYQDPSKAIRLARHAVNLSPGSSLLNYRLGVLFLDSKKYDKAEEYFKKAISFQYYNPEVYYNLACVLSLQMRENEAFLELDRAIQKGFDDYGLMQRDADLNTLKQQREKWLNLMKKNFPDQIKD